MPTGLSWLDKASDTSGLVPGGIYLIAGEPGIGKTTLCMQIAGSLAQREVKTLYLTTEQSLHELKTIAMRLHSTDRGAVDPRLNDHLVLDEDVRDLEQLPAYLERHVLTPGGRHYGARCVILDSIQGHGQSAGATAKYRALYRAIKLAKDSHCTALLTGHATKASQIAGPKTLEHNVDCVFWFRRALRTRLLFVPKNRFGRSTLEPIALQMDGAGRLREAPHATAVSRAAHGYTGGSWELAECQAKVSIPDWGAKSELNAPFLPSKRIKQLLIALRTLPDVNISDLSQHITCYLPAGVRYSGEIDFAIAMSLLGSYFQRQMPADALLVGEIDLTASIRRVNQHYIEDLGSLLRDYSSALGVSDVYIARESVAALEAQLKLPPASAFADTPVKGRVTRLSPLSARLAAILSENTAMRNPAHGAGRLERKGTRPVESRGPVCVHPIGTVLEAIKVFWPDLLEVSSAPTQR
jgi:DNA repair protein RadA/Sms